MAILAPAEGPVLDQILDATYDIWHDGLSRRAYARFYAAQTATAWGRAHLERQALVDGDEVLASAKLYMFDATLDGRTLRLAGLGAIFTQPAHRGRGAARQLVEGMLESAATKGADLALLFSEIGPDYYARLGFTPLPRTNRTLRVIEDARRGAPATMVRGGEERDLADIASMGAARAAAYRFHLNRDRDLIQFSIAKMRLLAGLGPPGARELRFFIAEEGASAAAYVVVSVKGREWAVEECGDRDPAGARAGAILQVLIAREPAEQRPAITGWLPAGFLPPQIAVVSERPSTDVMMVRALTSAGGAAVTLREEDVFYWRSDLF
jgi:GNAT superfamily N-acetyltransferase